MRPMRNLRDIAEFIERQPDMMRVLKAVEVLGLPDCWVGAGFVRNAVWDAVIGATPRRLNDVDVVFFDAQDRRRERESAVEAALLHSCPGPQWSVKNQARMNSRNGDAPYRDTLDAIAHWPETATAIAARVNRNRVELLAPYGVHDLLNLILRPTPPFLWKLEIFRQRVREKRLG
jgi:uncharacterized protein